jgi:hypothetical protein
MPVVLIVPVPRDELNGISADAHFDTVRQFLTSLWFGERNKRHSFFVCETVFSLLSLFRKNKSRLMKSPCCLSPT